MSPSFDALVSEGRDRFREGDGAGSRRAFEAALNERRTPEALEGLARALYLEGNYRRSMEVHEAAYLEYRQGKDALGAARAARIIAWTHGNLHGDWALGSGWLGRARSVLADAEPNTAEHAWLLAIGAIFESDPVKRENQFQEALKLGRAFEDANLQMEALGWLGFDLVNAGAPIEGKVLLDEALAAICAGEVDDLYVIEGVFCAMFGVCELTHDIPRVEQWLRAADEMVKQRSVVALGAFCRAHYGAILIAAGRWSEAEIELLEAVRIFDRGYEAMRATAVARLADLRVRQGRLEEAAVLLQGLEEHPDAARPLAARRLARGEVEWARDFLERRIASMGTDAVGVAPLLALLIDVLLEARDLDAAGEAVEQLIALSGRHSDDFLRGLSGLARGKLLMAAGQEGARSSLQGAIEAFSSAQMPVEAARARLELARCLAAERPQAAIAEAQTALNALEELEASRDADEAAQFLRSLGAAGRTGPKRRMPLTRREEEVFELLGAGLTNQEIGDRLYISSKTVEHHVGRILSKLQLRNRAEAAAQATRSAAPAR
jgi:DNA-binding CsgD family transcriptional regulator